MDMLRQLGNIIGCIYGLAFPFKNPKKYYFVLTVIKCILMAMLCLGKFMGTQSKVYFCIIMVGLGFLKIQLACIYYLAGKSSLK